MTYHRFLPLLLLGLPVTTMADHMAGGFGLQSSAPFWTESSQTLQQGKFFFGVRSQLQKLRSFSDNDLIQLRNADVALNPDFYEHHHDESGDESVHAKQADLHSVNTVVMSSFRAAYGITDDFTVGFRLPYIRRGGIREVESGHTQDDGSFAVDQISDHGAAGGIGDMSFWGQYSLFNDKKHSAAVILGFKAPTGDTSKQSLKRQYNYLTGENIPPDGAPERLETHLQPGSGSWDGMFGLAYGYDFTVVQFNSSLMYTLTTKGSQATDLGDSFNYNVAASIPVKKFTPCTGCSWNFVIEANGEWHDKEKRGDIYITNSGGHALYISPGIRFIAADKWNAGISAGFPVVNDWNGTQSEPDYRLMGTLNFVL